MPTCGPGAFPAGQGWGGALPGTAPGPRGAPSGGQEEGTHRWPGGAGFPMAPQTPHAVWLQTQALSLPLLPEVLHAHSAVQLAGGGSSPPWASLAHTAVSFGKAVLGVPCVLGVGWLRLQQGSVLHRETSPGWRIQVSPWTSCSASVSPSVTGKRLLAFHHEPLTSVWGESSKKLQTMGGPRAGCPWTGHNVRALRPERNEEAESPDSSTRVREAEPARPVHGWGQRTRAPRTGLVWVSGLGSTTHWPPRKVGQEPSSQVQRGWKVPEPGQLPQHRLLVWSIHVHPPALGPSHCHHPRNIMVTMETGCHRDSTEGPRQEAMMPFSLHLGSSLLSLVSSQPWAE